LGWGGGPPANAAKSLQVLVSRTRAACGVDAIVRDGTGYRLGVGQNELDFGSLGARVRDGHAALARAAAGAREAGGGRERDAAGGAELAREALALANGLRSPAADDGGSLGEIRRAA